MRSQLRNWDSKITFFAFADIITAVSGMLIFITLLLATDLGRPAGDRAAVAKIERQVQETLAQQAAADAQNTRLEELLSTAQTGPNLEKLQDDVARLKSQLDQERQKQTSLAGQIAASQASAQTRDARLGLADLRASVQRELEAADTLDRRERDTRAAMNALDGQVARLQSTLLKLRQRDGQIWLIPDKSATTKEPILVTVGGAGAVIERFDHPEQRRQLETSGADSAFKSYLRQSRALDQYVVFLVRPSGIGLFQELVQSARAMGFEVGYDALEEDRQIHFSTPPAVEETPVNAPSVTPDQKPSTAPGDFAPPAKTASLQPSAQENKPRPASPSVNSAPKKKTWWQRLLEWLGLA